MSKSSHDTSRLSRQLWAQFILALLAWAFAVLVTAFLARVVCGMRSWDGDEILYPLIHWMNRNVVTVYLFATGAGWLVISYRFIARPLRYLDAMAEAAQAQGMGVKRARRLLNELRQDYLLLNVETERGLNIHEF